MRYVLAVTCLLAVACAAPPDDADDDALPPPAEREEAIPAETDAAAAREAIDAQNVNFARWMGAGAMDSLAGLYTEDGIQMPPHREPLSGREAIREFWTGAAGAGEWSIELDTDDLAVSGPMAVETGSYVLTFEAGPDAPPEMASFEDRGKYLVHWQRGDDGVWRIARDAIVSTLPPGGAAE